MIDALREIIEDAFVQGHAAGVVDVRATWRKESDDLVYEAERKMRAKS